MTFWGSYSRRPARRTRPERWPEECRALGRGDRRRGAPRGSTRGGGDRSSATAAEATASARESDEKDADAKNESSHVLNPDCAEPTSRPAQQRAGEGIGLSIVKRLCELLDASLELASSAESICATASDNHLASASGAEALLSESTASACRPG